MYGTKKKEVNLGGERLLDPADRGGGLFYLWFKAVMKRTGRQIDPQLKYFIRFEKVVCFITF